MVRRSCSAGHRSGSRGLVAAVARLGLGQPGERAQVGQALAALDPPRVLPANRRGEAEHQAAALEQEPVELGLVLVRLTAEERLDLQAVPVGDQPGHRDQLVLALQPDEERAGLRLRVADPEFGQDAAEPRGRGHASTVAVTSLIASRYTARSWSTVADQPNPDACFLAPRDSLASRPGLASRSAISRA